MKVWWNTAYMAFDLSVWPCPWTSMAEGFTFHNTLLLWTFVLKIIKIHQGTCKIWSGPAVLMKYVLHDIWPPGMTLTLNQHGRMFRESHPLVSVNICTKHYKKNHQGARYGLDMHAWWNSVYMIVDLPVWLWSAHRLVIVNICTKYCQNPSAHLEDRWSGRKGMVK